MLQRNVLYSVRSMTICSLASTQQTFPGVCNTAPSGFFERPCYDCDRSYGLASYSVMSMDIHCYFAGMSLSVTACGKRLVFPRSEHLRRWS